MDDTSVFVIDARTTAAITKYSRHCHIRCAAAFGFRATPHPVEELLYHR